MPPAKSLSPVDHRVRGLVAVDELLLRLLIFFLGGGFRLLLASAGFCRIGSAAVSLACWCRLHRRRFRRRPAKRPPTTRICGKWRSWFPPEGRCGMSLAAACPRLADPDCRTTTPRRYFARSDRTRRVASSICRLTPLTGQGSIRMCWFPGANRGGKREHGDCTLQQSVAAPATVSGEFASKVATGQPGRPDADSDPRARRPASAVTQPVDGESIRSGCSQR